MEDTQDITECEQTRHCWVRKSKKSLYKRLQKETKKRKAIKESALEKRNSEELWEDIKKEEK